MRLAKRERLIAERADAAGGAYPVGVPITDTIPALRARYGDLEAGAETGVTAAVAGRVVFSRNTGKLCFATLQAGDGSRIQAMVSLAGVGEESLQQWKDLVDLGDHVFVSGEVISSRRGELSIMVADWQVAAKAILPLPNMYSELSEESRVRSRYLDLIVRDQARETVRARAKVNASLRQTFADRGYIEVETPMLQVQHGGASARPFVTRSNAFDTELYLRIAPELFLKRAVVGGLDRVFEINRNFRNEGADSTHSPEFAMLESYEAYSDYNGIADLTQDLVQNAAVAVAGSTTVTWADGTEYDLGGQWDRISMYDSLSAASGVSITPQTSLDELRALAAREGVEEPPLATHGKLVEELWEHFVKGDLVRPTFVMDFPLDTSPLVREHRSIAGCRGEVGSVRPRVRARDRLLRARRPGDPARALHRAGEARRARRPGGHAHRRGVPARARTRDAALGRSRNGHRPAAHGRHRPRHPRDDPLPAGQVARFVPSSTAGICSIRCSLEPRAARAVDAASWRSR